MEKTLDRIKELLIQKKYNEAYEFFASQVTEPKINKGQSQIA